MRLIDEFSERVLNESDSFNLSIKRDNGGSFSTYHFIQSTVGKGKYVYGVYDYWDDKCYSQLDLKPELTAITSGGTIYIVNEFFFGVYGKGSFPENVVNFNLVVREKNEYLKNAFPKFYDDLETVEIGDEITSCARTARELILSGNPVVERGNFNNLFSAREVSEMICGLTSLEEKTKKHFEDEREKWIHVKSFNKKVEELMKSNTGVEDWETAIAKGLRSVDAKTVTVEFELNAKKASAKMEPDIIRRHMLNNGYFSEYDFVTAKSGKELINRLGAGNWIGVSKEVLTCKHISRITYGKKELYVRG